MRLYFDTAYIAKCYLNEPDGKKVRALAMRATGLCSSSWCIAELACVFHRHIREGSLGNEEAARMQRLFLEHVEQQVWLILPLPDRLLFRVQRLVTNLPATIPLRAGDAVHLVTAQQAGFTEIWSNDRRLLGAAQHFGLEGRSV